MKKFISLGLLLVSMLIISNTVFAQSKETLSGSPLLSSDDLLDKVCRIESATLTGGVYFLAVVVCIENKTDSRSGFYFKDNAKWHWISTENFKSRNCLPVDIMCYKDAIINKSIGRPIGTSFKLENLVVLIYEDENGVELFDVFDLVSKKLLALKF